MNRPAGLKWFQRAGFRPVHVWVLGSLLFLRSLVAWIFHLVLFGRAGILDWSLDRDAWLGVWLPFLAAVIGFFFPIVCLRVLRDASWRRNATAFALYLCVMVTWGVIDLHYERYQIGGHYGPGGDGGGLHRHYFHDYWTWYFLPYHWIERF